ncbi:protein adenylyltransferase SelO [Coralliovum pocilloporae]|uniref:protein adenylyltransferase SelO n=1 Tax=Coralliovum pocilloporae TaxID=3066369 RepID=UPI003307A88D
MADIEAIPFDNSYARLPDRFYARLAPTPVAEPGLIRLNEPLARHLGLDPENLKTSDGIAMLAGNHVPDGAAPLAMVYAGHQFGGWVPQLGDGRAILLGELIGSDGLRYDLQLKGAGRTPYSRGGDGRAWLGPVLREYILSEAMAALGIPTTRALAAVTTADRVIRELLYPGAVLTRIARSHLRVGTFQYFAARRDDDALMRLADYAIDRHDPDLKHVENPYLALLEAVVHRQAELVIRWLSVGFIHGVMNTDNMTISGETIDYGPCAFMDAYNPDRVFSSIDQYGRYAYQQQPAVAQWNLTQLATSLLPLIDNDRDTAATLAKDALGQFSEHFNTGWEQALRQKIGLAIEERTDLDLAHRLLTLMAENEADFTLVFRTLSDLAIEADITADQAFLDLFKAPHRAVEWLSDWRRRLGQETRSDLERQAHMKRINPAYIPRNHRVEDAIQAGLRDDFTPFEILIDVLSRPFDDQPDKKAYQAPPKPEEQVRKTFCGT